MSDGQKARKILFSGQVQGVGFRYRCEQLSTRFSVSGTVRNLPTGQVELCVVGQNSEINKFICAIVDHFSSHIAQVDESKLENPAEYSGFRILR